MRALNSILLVVLFTTGAAGQDTVSTPSVASAPGVEVVANSWRRILRNPKLDQDPLQVNRDQANLEQAQRDAIIDNAAIAKADARLPPRRIPTQAPGTRAEVPRGLIAEYVYEIRLRNTGTKTIRKLFWTYVPLGLAHAESSSREFNIKTRIQPGKTKKLVVRTNTPPVRTVRVIRVGEESAVKPQEQLVIKRIEYDDGSVWTRNVN